VAGTPFSVRLGISGTMSLRELFVRRPRRSCSSAATPSPPPRPSSNPRVRREPPARRERHHHLGDRHGWTTVPEASGLASDLAAALGLVALQRRAVRTLCLTRHEAA
jgi:hypothetical protein